MAEWIISFMPPHQTYLEPYFGSGAVFFSKEPSPLETINDIDGDVVNLFRVIRDRPEELARLVYWTPYSREEYYNSYQAGGGSWTRWRERGVFWCGAGWRVAQRQAIGRDGGTSSTTVGLAW
jgi:DNA adenine methylase